MSIDQLASFDYHLPPELIATKPATPRDSSRLFVYDTQNDHVHFDTFANIDRYLPERSLLVLNNTTVLPVRVPLRKENGGVVNVVFLVNEYKNGQKTLRAMVDRKVVVGQKLAFPSGEHIVARDQADHIFTFEFLFHPDRFRYLLNAYGTTPIPQYIKTDLSENILRERYQTIFAHQGASVAAPTASLHFTPEVFHRLAGRGIATTEITLNVGLGTFAPVGQKEFAEKRLHTETGEISPESAQRLYDAVQQGRPIVAVGTTATRALESAADAVLHNNSTPFSTDIFIFHPYHFRIVNYLITNFHIPKSSLMCLVDAFLRDKGAKRSLVELYELAIKERFRFYSFGDSMLIL